MMHSKEGNQEEFDSIQDMLDEPRQVGEIFNYYGGVHIKQEEDKYFWTIEDWDDWKWREIPKYLFDALTKHQDELEAEEEK
jgi:hypothetical protein